MSLTGLLEVVAADAAISAAVGAPGRSELDLTAPAPLRPFVVAALADGMQRPILTVTATGREAEDLAAALRSLLPPDSVVEFPSWETLPHERLSPRADTVGRRPGADPGGRRAGALAPAADGRVSRRPRADPGEGR
jgi:transcription-repair coupling factor (superfamily II helicase)